MRTDLLISAHRNAVFTCLVRHAARLIEVRLAQGVWRRNCRCDLGGNGIDFGASCPPGRAATGRSGYRVVWILQPACGVVDRHAQARKVALYHARRRHRRGCLLRRRPPGKPLVVNKEERPIPAVVYLWEVNRSPYSSAILVVP